MVSHSGKTRSAYLSPYNSFKEKLYRCFIVEKLNNAVGFVLLGSGAIIASWITVNGGIPAGTIILLAVIGVPIALICLLNLQVGFNIALVVSSLIFIVPRISGQYDIPVGPLSDILLLIILLGLFVNKKNRFETVTTYRSPIFLIVVIWIGFLLLQTLNPNGPSNTWPLILRGVIGFAAVFFIFTRLFTTWHSVRLFTYCWLAIALLAALYAFYQEFVGLPSYDLTWVNRSPKSIGLNFIRGRWRKWSFLSDVATFGMFMSFAGVFAIVLAAELKDYRKKALLLIAGLLMLVAMTYSGTRTAIAMTVAGIVMYGLLTIHKKSTMLLGISTVMVILAIMYVPYYGSATINSMRSTFFPTSDPSFNVRVVNKERIQPYIRSHPIGGGLNTTGPAGEELAPNHPLAGFPPDSYYMSIALETGYIGLGIVLLVFFTTLWVGIANYSRCRNPVVKAVYAAYIASFFALTVAGYAQESITQLPMRFVFYSCFVLMDRLKYFDEPYEPAIAQNKLRVLQYER